MIMEVETGKHMQGVYDLLKYKTVDPLLKNKNASPLSMSQKVHNQNCCISF